MKHDIFSRGALGASVVASLVWVGMVIGVSFLATPVKFQASSLSLPVALEVGKVTFGLFTKVEWLLAGSLLAAAIVPRASGMILFLSVPIVGAVVVQSLWLLPVLDDRIDAVIGGYPKPPSWHHLVYALVEGLKVVMLASVAIFALSRLTARPGATAEEE